VSDATSLLDDLEGFTVVSVANADHGLRRVVIMQIAAEHACPRVRDLPMGHRPVHVIWRKRRYRCVEVRCPQRVFTERSREIPPRHRLMAPLCVKRPVSGCR